MATHKVFESDVATNARAELQFNDAAASGFTGWEFVLINSADAIVRTIALTSAQQTLLIAITKNESNGSILLIDQLNQIMTIGRDNESSISVLEGATPEYASLTPAQTMQVCGWIKHGWTDAPA